MKSYLFRTAFVLFLSLFAVSSFAYWQCRAHNLRGQNFVGTGPDRSTAFSAVNRFCVRNSFYAANCIQDGCVVVGGPVAPVIPGASWTCSIRNARGETFNGIGVSRADASANAARICSRNSTYASTCRILSCWRN